MSHRISNTNCHKQSISFIRVYNDAGEMIAEQAINKRNPVAYIQGVTNSKHKRELYAQCIQGGMSHDEFVAEFGEVKLPACTATGQSSQQDKSNVD